MYQCYFAYIDAKDLIHLCLQDEDTQHIHMIEVNP